jgi:hypothetical protein
MTTTGKKNSFLEFKILYNTLLAKLVYKILAYSYLK